MKEPWKWQFRGFESEAEKQPVQAWFDSLQENDRFEILDLLVYLANQTANLWRRPEFDPLPGAHGISEIRVPNIRSARGIVTYRIYGYFGPETQQYCFLHGTAKDVKNDKHGKGIAERRLDELRNRKATTHKFSFEKNTVVEIKGRC